ncbi:GNAT family N-acetyltransferase [Pseudalkalibacillus berkeleyi]|uniref:GNAT family N-acetyltransferase n=1 Tax=Pseudalkalibacillus berkeleyi TaxID=1069813 RepID=A0ABS9GUP6_9BACL|nr:GNAT family N-acetyltransferase [Pseudalkalibacillus berkeleyi]MCF6136404.1 GNAT family N-acetyltransferase [Pseudalkalibacillus berkeleyi]
MEYLLREGQDSDFEKLKPIHKEVHDLHVMGRPDHYKTTEDTLDEKYFRGLINENGGKVYVIELDLRLIGFIFLRLRESPDRTTHVKSTQLFVEDFGVSGSYKGQGLGKLLFDKAVEVAKEMNASRLELGVWEFNQAAIQFYESLGMSTQVRKMELKIK